MTEESKHYKFKVETTFAPGDVRDHRKGGFTQEQYFRNMQDGQKKEAKVGFPPMDSVTKPPKPKGGTKTRSRKKTTDDAAVEAANTKDLKTRNLK